LLFTRAALRATLTQLETLHPHATTELTFRNAFELLVATILSAQCTDARVNAVTPGLFDRFADASELARVEAEALEPLIQSTGFFRAKSRNLVAMAQALVDDHGGEVPSTMDALVALPGVGRKTANVVLGHALNIPGLPVDRHVLRVANRLGLVKSDDPEVVEDALSRGLPPHRWTQASDTLILHGRRVCRPKPLCDRCPARRRCRYYRSLGAQRTARRAPSRPEAP
jgi:endonuclease-3